MSKKFTPLANKYRPKTFSDVVYQDHITKELQGLVERKAYRYMNSIVIAGGSGAGKAQPLTSKVLTPDRGFVKLADIEIGDDIYGEDGKIYKVTGKFPQGKKDVYRLYFNNLAKVECCEEHLWAYYRNGKPNNKIVKPLKELMQTNHLDGRVHLRNIEPLQREEREHIIPPYVMGYLLAEGSFKENSIIFSTSEKDLVGKIKKLSRKLYKVRKIQSDNYSYIMTQREDIRRSRVHHLEALRTLGLKNLKSTDKFIPDEYLKDSISNRLELLRGLMDGDGNVTVKRDGAGSTVGYSTSSAKLCRDFITLVQELGYKFLGVSEDKRYENINYTISFKQTEDLPLAFTSKKHISKFKYPKRYKTRNITITKIKKLKRKKEMVCISTSNPTKIYITDGYIPTHNTTISRILVKAINCEGTKEKPCNACANCKAIDEGNFSNYVELDATSYRSVNDIDPLLNLANSAVIGGGTRVIYLDESHTLSNQAWDKLLKPLEDSVNNTLWIFATTQLHSIRPAILGRSMVFKVKNIPTKYMREYLEHIVKEEKIKVNPELLDTIVRVKRHGLRDCITELDKYYKSYGRDLTKVSLEELQSVEDEIIQILIDIKEKGFIEALISLEQIEIKEFQKAITNILLSTNMVDKEEESIKDFGCDVKLIKKFNNIYKDFKELPQLVLNYRLDTFENCKLFLLMIYKWLEKSKEDDTIIKEVQEEEDTSLKIRKGVKTIVKDKDDKKPKKNKKAKKKGKDKHKPKKSKEVKSPLIDLGFDKQE